MGERKITAADVLGAQLGQVEPTRSIPEAAAHLVTCAGCDEARKLPTRVYPGWICEAAEDAPVLVTHRVVCSNCPLGYWGAAPAKSPEPVKPPGIAQSGRNLLASIMELTGDARQVFREWYAARLGKCQTCPLRTCRRCGGTGKRRGRRGRPCRKCEGTGRGVTCGSCGCDVRLKARWRVWKCPEGKWAEIDTRHASGEQRAPGEIATGSSSGSCGRAEQNKN